MDARPTDSLVIPAWAQTHAIVRFFYLFSRCEYALKRAGDFHQNAVPNWDKLGKRLGAAFFDDARSKAKVFFDRPVEKQVVSVDGDLSWEPQAAPANCVDLFLAVRRVRNNLFHGGKYPMRPVEEPARNADLIEAASLLLEQAVLADRAIRDWFKDDSG
jgi:hypothetical protein